MKDSILRLCNEIYTYVWKDGHDNGKHPSQNIIVGELFIKMDNWMRENKLEPRKTIETIERINT